MESVVHLAKRAWKSKDNRPISGHHVERAERLLRYEEFELWWAMAPRDQAHSIEVLDRFLEIIPYAKREEQAAALLHDVGKNASRLNWPLRVVATVVGPRGSRFAKYHMHERIGLEMLSGISDQRTIEILNGTAEEKFASALRAADNI
jgi:hypothetical protein